MHWCDQIRKKEQMISDILDQDECHLEFPHISHSTHSSITVAEESAALDNWQTDFPEQHKEP